MLVVTFLEDIAERRNSNGQADQSIGESVKVLRQSVEFSEIGNQYRTAQSPEQVHPIEIVAIIDLGIPLHLEMPEGHLGDDEDILATIGRLVPELGERAVEHIDRVVGDRPESAAQDEDRLLVKSVGRLDDLAVRREHRGVGQATVDELKAHQAIVNPREGRASELNQVDLNSLVAQTVEQMADQ